MLSPPANVLDVVTDRLAGRPLAATLRSVIRPTSSTVPNSSSLRSAYNIVNKKKTLSICLLSIYIFLPSLI